MEFVDWFGALPIGIQFLIGAPVGFVLMGGPWIVLGWIKGEPPADPDDDPPNGLSGWG